MKKMWLVAVATLMMALPVVAQQKTLTPEEKAQRQAVKMENRCLQLAAALTLDDAKTIKFVDAYTRYNNDMHAVRKQFKMHQPKKADIKAGEAREELTDAQVEENILARFAMSRAILEVRETYYKEFRSFMNPKQIQKLYQFEKKQGAKMQQHKQHGPKKPMGPRPQGKPAQRR